MLASYLSCVFKNVVQELNRLGLLLVSFRQYVVEHVVVDQKRGTVYYGRIRREGAAR